MPPSVPRIVVLVNQSPAGRAVLAGLSHRGVPIAGVIVETPWEFRYCRRARTTLGRIAEIPVALARSVRRRVRAHRLITRHAGPSAARLLAATRNAEDVRRFVADAGTDLLVLAGVGLVSRELLAIPRMGTLNSHPGLVPWVRGNGAVCNAILRGVAVGASCHRVDPGIDTGPVIARRLLPIRELETLELLEARAVQFAAGLLADVVADVVERGALSEGRGQSERYPLGRRQDARGRAETAELLAAGRALDLYHRWKPLCRSPDSDDLREEIPGESLPPLSIAPTNTDPLRPAV